MRLSSRILMNGYLDTYRRYFETSLSGPRPCLVGSAASSGQLVPHDRSDSAPLLRMAMDYGPSSRALRGERRPGAGRGEEGAGHHNNRISLTFNFSPLMRNPIFSIWKGHKNHSRCSVIESMVSTTLLSPSNPQLFRFIVSPLSIVIVSKTIHGAQSVGVIVSKYSFSFLQALPAKLTSSSAQ